MFFLSHFFSLLDQNGGPNGGSDWHLFDILFRYFFRPFSKVVLGRVGGRFLMDFEGFWKDFGLILGASWMDFG